MIKTQAGRTQSILGILFIVLLSLLFRRYDAFVNPQLWAEDGPIFLQQFYEKGFASLITPYAGYLHTTQRLIVLFFGKIDFNLLYIPLLYNITVVLLVFFIAFSIWKSSASLNINNRIVFATFFLFTPVMSDVFMNITNLNGILSLYLVNFLLTRDTGTTKVSAWVNAIVILLISLSGPGSVLLGPVVVLVLFLERKTLTMRTTLPLVLILVGGGIQAVCIKFVDNGFYRGVPGAIERYHLLRFFVNNTADLVYLNYGFLPDMPHRVKMYIALVVLVAIAGFIAQCYIKLQNKRKYVLVLSAVLYTTSVIIAYWPGESHLTALGNASRYFIVPYTLLGWVLILALDKRIKSVQIAGYLLFLFFHSRSLKFELQDKNWDDQVMEYRDGGKNVIDINPEGWKVVLPPKTKK